MAKHTERRASPPPKPAGRPPATPPRRELGEDGEKRKGSGGEGLNRVTLVGNLGQDPELRFTQGGDGVLSMSMATTERWSDKDGDRQERTEWHRVTMFGARAEALSKFLTKGRKILVEGSLRTTSYEKDGVTRYSTEIVARNLLILDKPKSEGGEPPF